MSFQISFPDKLLHCFLSQLVERFKDISNTFKKDLVLKMRRVILFQKRMIFSLYGLIVNIHLFLNLGNKTIRAS